MNLPVVDAWDRPDGKGIVLSAGRATIELLDEADAAFTDRTETGDVVGAGVRLAVNVGDTRVASAALQSNGAYAVGPLVHTPWGHLNQRLRTPDGLQVTVFQEQSAEVEPA